MKTGDLVRAKNPVYFTGIGIVIKDDYKSPWEDAVRVAWFDHNSDHSSLMRVFDLKPAF